MQFNDTTNNSGICQEADAICKTDSTSYPLKDKSRRANSALSDFTSIALDSDERWQFGDTNNTDLPIGSADLVSGQDDYSLDIAMLKLLKIEVKDSSGNWAEIKPLDQADAGIPLAEQLTTGVPQYYDKLENSLILYPTPDYSQVESLKVYFQRDASYFVSTDTTKQPGIPTIFHKYIALKVAEPYLRDNKKENYVSVRNEVQKYEEEKIPGYYAKRSKDERPQFTARVIDCR